VCANVGVRVSACARVRLLSILGATFASLKPYTPSPDKAEHPTFAPRARTSPPPRARTLLQ